MKVALVCDWLTNVGGAEKVLLAIHRLYPDAPIYTSKYSKKGIDWFLDADVRTGWLQIFPVCLRRFLGVFRQSYFSHLDLSDYDLVISVTGAEAKSVKCRSGLHKKTTPKSGKNSHNGAIHICYCHVPTQYYWQMYDDYLAHPGFGILSPLVRFFFKLLVRPLRRADFKSAQRPDFFVTISDHAKKQIKTYYHRDAFVIHPPVEIADFSIRKPQHQPAENSITPTELANTYICTSRQVNWKRLDLCVKACLKVGQPLLIIGEGPEHDRLVRLAGGSPLIKFLPLMDKTALKYYLSHAKAFLFPSLEPFGIAPVEAMAAGCPVIAFAEGGSLDYIQPRQNGLLFKKQSVVSLASALQRFDTLKFDRQKVSASVDHFSADRFNRELANFINEKLADAKNSH